MVMISMTKAVLRPPRLAWPLMAEPPQWVAVCMEDFDRTNHRYPGDLSPYPLWHDPVIRIIFYPG